jgi:hypothetical protein
MVSEDTFRSTGYAMSNYRILGKDEFGMMRRQQTVAYFKVLSR